jgi:hypothetical protein
MARRLCTICIGYAQRIELLFYIIVLPIRLFALLIAAFIVPMTSATMHARIRRRLPSLLTLLLPLRSIIINLALVFL